MLTVTNDAGEPHSRVLSAINLDETLYVAGQSLGLASGTTTCWSVRMFWLIPAKVKYPLPR